MLGAGGARQRRASALPSLFQCTVVATVEMGSAQGVVPRHSTLHVPEAEGPAPQSGAWVPGGGLRLTHFCRIRSEPMKATWHCFLMAPFSPN